MWTFPKLKIERDSTDNFLWKLPLCTVPRHTYFLLSNEFNISGITWRVCLSRVTFHVICKRPSSHRWFRSRIPQAGESRSLYFWANFHKCVVSKIWRFVGIFAQWQPFQNVKAKFFIPFYPDLNQKPAWNQEPQCKKTHMFFWVFFCFFPWTHMEILSLRKACDLLWKDVFLGSM